MPASNCAKPPYASASPSTIGSPFSDIRPELKMLSTNVVSAKAASPSGPGSAVTGFVSTTLGVCAAAVSPRGGSGASAVLMPAAVLSLTEPSIPLLLPMELRELSPHPCGGRPSYGFGSRVGAWENAPGLGGVDLEDHRVALAAARADRRHAEAAAATPQLVHQRAENARAPRADRVTERDGPAVHVDLLLVDAEHAHRVDGHGREGLVDLEQVDVVDAEAGLLERLLRCVGGCTGEVREVVGHLRVRDDRGERRVAVLLRPGVAGEDEGAGAVVHAGRVAGRVGAVLHEDRLELGEALEAGVAARRRVDLDRGVALLRRDRDRHDL